MTDPADSLRAYVRAALQLQGYEFTEERIAEITTQFARIESIARNILPADAGLEGEEDPGTAAVFRP